jgi:parallel beta-helix repeat protein
MGDRAADGACRGTYYVDNSGNAPCSSNGPGTEAQPFCTISAALSKVGGPGTTILVKAGRYPEMVTMPVSGAAGNPLVIEALGTVTIDGADVLGEGLWTPFSGDVWVSPIGWAPAQVLRNNAPLLPSTDDPALLTPGSWRYVAGQGLYVNACGGKPDTLGIQAGHRLNGFPSTASRGSPSRTSSSSCPTRKASSSKVGPRTSRINNNVVTLCASGGISLFGCADVTIAWNHISHNVFHGIELRGGSTGCKILGNDSSWNADRPSTVATGIYLNGSPDNRLENNKVSHNGDTGIEIQGGSDNCVSIQNVAFDNHDHGFEHLFSVGTVNVGNVAWRNGTDGISIEGSSQNTSVFDCISVDNCLPTSGFDFFVDANSTAGMTSDYNLFWNSTSQKPIKWNGVQYATVGAYATASGLDSHTLQADPMFVDPASGFFHLQDGSPPGSRLGISGVRTAGHRRARAAPRGRSRHPQHRRRGDRVCRSRRLRIASPTWEVGDPTAFAKIALSNAFRIRVTVRWRSQSICRVPRRSVGRLRSSGRKLGGGSTWRAAGAPW